MDSAKRLAWLTFLASVTTLGVLIYQTVATTKSISPRSQVPAVDGGPVKIEIDAATCKASPEYAYLDPDVDGRRHVDRPNHYEVQWTVKFDNQPAARKVTISYDKANSKNIPVGNPLNASYEVDRTTATAVSGKPRIGPNASFWAYTIAVLGEGGESLCPAIDPGICVPGMGGDCRPGGFEM